MTTPQWTVDDNNEDDEGAYLSWDGMALTVLELTAEDDGDEVDWPTYSLGDPPYAALVADVAAARLVDRLREAAEQADAERDSALNTLAALQADATAAARLVDDMAAVVRRLERGWRAVDEGPPEGWWWVKGHTDEEPMSPGEVAALHHARRQEREA